MIITGIDPGNSGSIAVMDLIENTVEVYPMPETDKDIFTIFENIKLKVEQRPKWRMKAYLEQVHAFPEQGVTSVWTFAENYGKLKMALTASGIPFELVTPLKWQKRLAIPPRPKDASKTYHKNVLKQKAQQLFPNTHITLQTADALLIMEYGRRCEEFSHE